MDFKVFQNDSVSLDHDSPFIDDHLSRYRWIQDQVSGNRVLDCACGKGYGSYLASLSAKSVVGIDLSDQSLEIARQRFQRPNLTFERVDVLKLSERFPEGEFDTVIAFEIIEHIPQATTEIFLAEIAKVLKTGGKLILSTPNHDVVLKSGVQIPEFHINNFKPQNLSLVLKKFFSEVTLLGQFNRRGYLNHFIFSLDFFNLRHFFSGFIQKLSMELRPPLQAKESFVPVDASFLDQYSTEQNEYRFSPHHWRQAGLTMAVAKRPRQ